MLVLFLTGTRDVQKGKHWIIICIMDSSLSSSVGYVEFYDEESVQNALAMSGQKLLGIPVLVQMSEAEKNRYAMAQEQNR